jgi:hypothetical protein
MFKGLPIIQFIKPWLISTQELHCKFKYVQSIGAHNESHGSKGSDAIVIENIQNDCRQLRIIGKRKEELQSGNS